MTLRNYSKKNVIREDGSRVGLSNMSYVEQAQTPTFAEQREKEALRESELPQFAPPGAGYEESEYWIMPPFGLDWRFDSPIFAPLTGKGAYDIVFMAWSNDCYNKGETTPVEIRGNYPIVSIALMAPSNVTLLGGPVHVDIEAPENGPGYALVDVGMVTPNNQAGVPAGIHGLSRATIRACEDACKCNVEIGYTTQQMVTSADQTLSVVGDDYDSECHTWALASGGGSLGAAQPNGDIVYTAPATNANCSDNPTIALSCDGVVVDTLKIAITSGVNYLAFTRTSAVCAYNSAYREWRCSYTQYRCNGAYDYSGQHPQGFVSEADCQTDGPGGCPGMPPAPEDWSICSGVLYHITDIREAAMCTAGCCPAALL